MIKQLFADVLQISGDEILDTSSPATIPEWDSLNHLNLIATFEGEMGLDIEPEDIPKMMQDYSTFRSVIINKIG